MKHRIFGKKLGRTHNQRQALLTGLVRNVYTHGSIQTTEAKAKSVIPLVERLASVLTSSPELIAKRELYRYLQDQNWVNRVYSAMTSTFVDQKSNFTTITKIKFRQGDDTLIVKLAFCKPINFKPAEIVKPKKVVKKTIVKKPVTKSTRK